jgi:hypothetical protein
MGKYEIWSRHDKTAALEPEIFYDITVKELEATQTAWLSYKRLYPPQPLPAHHEWNWTKKALINTDFSLVSLKYAGETHGLMMVALSPQTCRLPGSTHNSLLYVEYLETAPWNQKAYAGPKTRFVGVGSCLLDVAIDMSIAHKCEGRLGLHSLPDARTFYASQGFQTMGEDPAEQLDYFELGDNELGNKEST